MLLNIKCYKNKNIPPFCNVLRLKQKTEKYEKCLK